MPLDDIAYARMPLGKTLQKMLVAMLPHIHDHTLLMEIALNNPDNELTRFIADLGDTPSYHIDHSGRCPNHGWHQHGDGGGHHINVRGLSVWTPGLSGPILLPADRLLVTTLNFNSHSDAADGMANFGAYVVYLD